MISNILDIIDVIAKKSKTNFLMQENNISSVHNGDIINIGSATTITGSNIGRNNSISTNGMKKGFLISVWENLVANILSNWIYYIVIIVVSAIVAILNKTIGFLK